jgi:uncharacterized membrane protein
MATTTTSAHRDGRFSATRGLRFGRESFADSRAPQEWTVRWQLKRNCSLAPRQLLACYLGLCLLSLAIAAGFWSVGALMVLPFAGAEFGRRVERVEFAPAWVRVEPRHGDHSLIELSGQGRRISVGRFVRPELRREFADELRWALRRWNPGVAGETV